MARSGRQSNPIDVYVGARIRLLRLAVSSTQEKVAAQLGVTFQQIQKYETGKNRVSASRLQEIASFLDVPVAFFFEGAPIDEVATSRAIEPSEDDTIPDFFGSNEGLELARALCVYVIANCEGVSLPL